MFLSQGWTEVFLLEDFRLVLKVLDGWVLSRIWSRICRFRWFSDDFVKVYISQNVQILWGTGGSDSFTRFLDRFVLDRFWRGLWEWSWTGGTSGSGSVEVFRGVLRGFDSGAGPGGGMFPRP